MSEGEYEQAAQQEIKAIIGSSLLEAAVFRWCTDIFYLDAIDKLCWVRAKGGGVRVYQQFK